MAAMAVTGKTATAISGTPEYDGHGGERRGNQMTQQASTAFVFAGGGSLGAVQVGMLHELMAHGVHPDFVVGSSAGAINAAYFAGAPDASGVSRLEELWSTVRRKDIMPLSLRDMISMLVWRRASLISVTGIRQLLERHLAYRKIEDAALRLHIVATDNQLGSEVVLSSGPVIEAVMASAAIPGIFPPVQIGGRELVDGGVANNTPISVALRLGATRIIVLPGEQLVATGPYRWLTHPNYVVVIGEIAVLPLCLGLPWYALAFSLANAAVLTVRIRAENAALHPSRNLGQP